MKHQHAISFKHATHGIITAFTTQPNFRIHTLIGLAVIISGYFLAISTQEWLILVLTMTFVVVTELINTSIEAVVDLITEQHNQYAKIAKDVAAAAVLSSAISSIIIGLIIFLPKII